MNSINFKKDVQTKHPSVRSTGWLKTVTGIDKSKRNGYSLQGEFVRKGDFETNYADGLYVDCSKLRKPKQSNYHIFKVTDGDFELLQTIEDGDRTWAVQLWDTIEENLSDDPNYKARALANLVLEQCSDENTLDEVARLLFSDRFERQIFFRNQAHFESFLASNNCHEIFFHREDFDEAFERYSEEKTGKYSKKYNPYEATVLAWATTCAYKEHGKDAKHFTEEDVLNGNIKIDFKRIEDPFDIFKDSFFYHGNFGLLGGSRWEFHQIEEFNDTNYYGFYFNMGNYILLSRHYNEGDWDSEDRLIVRVFGDAFKNSGVGFLEE